MSFMEDEDDDFGDLYTDVLLPVNTPSSSSSQPPPPQPSSDLNDDDKKLYGGSSNFKLSTQPLVSDRNHGGERENFVAEEVVTRVSPKEDASRVLDFGVSVKSEPFVSPEIGDDVRVDDDDESGGNLGAGAGAGTGGEVKMERMDMDDWDGQPMIPGLSSSFPFDPPAPPPGVFQLEEEEGVEPMEASKREEDEWDSDSDSKDNLKIVLNEDEHDGMNGKENEGDGGGQGLVIVAGDDQIHHTQLGEEQELGEDELKH